jgi:hypothetical protein
LAVVGIAAGTRRPALALALGAAALALGVTLPPAPAAAAMPAELVPAYFTPEGSPDPWQSMCEAGPPGSIAILNPRNGPVKRAADSYLPAITYCREQGWRVVGYVFTRYGKRSLKAVEKAIANYYLWYPGVEGIFFDEMAEAPSAKTQAYYASLAADVHERGGVAIGNPGDTAATNWQLAVMDTIVTFEGSAESFASYRPAAWVGEAGPARIADIVFAAPGAAAMEAVCRQATEQGAGFVYVTDLPERPNPYAALPSYWDSEREGC